MAHEVTSEMPGTVWQIVTMAGNCVDPDHLLLVLESMKLEIPVHSTIHGVVLEVCVSEGDFVREGDVLVRLGDHLPQQPPPIR